MRIDVLDALEHVLLNTPTDAYVVVPIKRKTLAAAAKEIRTLREALAQQANLLADSQARTGVDGRE